MDQAHLFRAIERVRLAPDISEAGYSRCGRTDVGVSAFGNVVALRVRCCHEPPCAPVCPGSEAVPPPRGKLKADYASRLNQQLPPEIRVVGCAEVDDTFSARFNCTGRTYKYFFNRDGRDLEVFHVSSATTCSALR